MPLVLSRRSLGARFSEGSRLLWAALDVYGTQGALTKVLGAKPGMVSRWLYGDVKPGWYWAGRLDTVLGIPLRSWGKEPKKPFIPPAARAA
ncbi:hypothetical protein [Pendulispora albinea]|uniref:Helix-turn-helix domain-containing protein n=1 Tax=Pendulispora albinea TaxID=2741071 RepID=A0ABZ2LWQ7_9BACT